MRAGTTVGRIAIDAAHALRLDGGWRRSAERLEGWISRTFEAAEAMP